MTENLAQTLMIVLILLEQLGKAGAQFFEAIDQQVTPELREQINQQRKQSLERFLKA